MRDLHHLCQKWERVLFTTGGAINLSKSFWVLMAWQWKKGNPLLKSWSSHSHSLSLMSGYNTSQAIQVPQMSPYDAYRTLGAYLSPSGNQEKAYQVLRQKSLDYIAKIQSASITKEATLWSYILYLLPQLTYSMIYDGYHAYWGVMCSYSVTISDGSPTKNASKPPHC